MRLDQTNILFAFLFYFVFIFISPPKTEKEKKKKRKRKEKGKKAPPVFFPAHLAYKIHLQHIEPRLHHNDLPIYSVLSQPWQARSSKERSDPERLSGMFLRKILGLSSGVEGRRGGIYLRCVSQVPTQEFLCIEKHRILPSLSSFAPLVSSLPHPGGSSSQPPVSSQKDPPIRIEYQKHPHQNSRFLSSMAYMVASLSGSHSPQEQRKPNVR